MTRRPGRSSGAAPRVGFFGLLGAGNLGNDASFEAALRYVRTDRPDAIVDVMCSGPNRLKAAYGVNTVPLQWYLRHVDTASGVKAVVLKALGKSIDAFRTASWTRRHDVVIVAGMGVFETSLPVRAIGLPYALFLLCVSGRLFATNVALVSIGATETNERATRWLFDTAARLARYRSYRDHVSLEEMQRRGIGGPRDAVSPDLVFSLPAPDDGPGAPDVVGVGVMKYYGGNDDRAAARDIHVRYMSAMKRFVVWLVDNGHRVRLFGGDDADADAVDEIFTYLRASRPDLDPASLVAAPCSSQNELMAEMALVGTVVCTRYHNVVAALRLSKPTISIGYSAKHDALMAEMGLSEFARSARYVDADDLIGRFAELKKRAPELRRHLLERSAEKRQEVDNQFAILASRLLPGRRSDARTSRQASEYIG